MTGYELVGLCSIAFIIGRSIGKSTPKRSTGNTTALDTPTLEEREVALLINRSGKNVPVKLWLDENED